MFRGVIVQDVGGILRGTRMDVMVWNMGMVPVIVTKFASSTSVVIVPMAMTTSSIVEMLLECSLGAVLFSVVVLFE